MRIKLVFHIGKNPVRTWRSTVLLESIAYALLLYTAKGVWDKLWANLQE